MPTISLQKLGSSQAVIKDIKPYYYQYIILHHGRDKMHSTYVTEGQLKIVKICFYIIIGNMQHHDQSVVEKIHKSTARIKQDY